MLTALAGNAPPRRQLSQEHHAQPRRRGWPVRLLAWLATRIAAVLRRRMLPPAAKPDAFVSRLRSLASGAEPGVVEIALHVADSPLPRNVEVIELGDREDPRAFDAVVVVKGTQLCAADRARTPVGDLRRAATGLAELLEHARMLRLTARAVDAIAEIVAAVDAEDRALAGDFAGRVADLEDLRIADPAGFARDQIDRVRAQIYPSVSMVMEHVAVHLNSDLAQLGNEWRTAIERVSTSGELGTAVTKLNETSAASVRRIAEDARVLVMGGVGGCVRDLFATVVAPLRQHGLSDALAKPRPNAPPLPKVPVLPSLAAPSAANVGSAGWFAALFRSVDSRRADIRGKVEGHIARLEDIAVAEMRDAEPTLHAAVEAALRDELAAAIERQRVWLDGAIAAEHAEFALHREAVAERTARVDAARREVQRLRDQLAQLAAAHPRAAAVSAWRDG